MIPRRILTVLESRVLEDPVVALHGPRSVGKSTVLADFAALSNVEVIDLDIPAVRQAVTSAPGLVTEGPRPICIDEYQHVPEVLRALKALLNTGAVPATAVLTGSTRHDALPRTAESLTGRLGVLTILPLSQGEIIGVEEDFIAQLLAEPAALLANHPVSSTARTEYIDKVCAGGFPLALQRTGTSRNRWFDAYVQTSIERDAQELAAIRQRDILKALLGRLAGQTAQLLNMNKAASDLSMPATTIESYTRLLEDLFLIQRLPAWGTSLRARVGNKPKVHVVDSGLAARLLRISPAKLAGLNPTALTEFGNLFETFVVNEICKQVSWLDGSVTVGHWRTHDDDEVDLVLEDDDGNVFGFEIKSGDQVPGSDLGGLRKLRVILGTRFAAGIAFHTGTRSYTAEDRIHVIPADRLWS
jgi:uncharacterized protein